MTFTSLKDFVIVAQVSEMLNSKLQFISNGFSTINEFIAIDQHVRNLANSACVVKLANKICKKLVHIP